MSTFVNPLFNPSNPDEYDEWIVYCAFLEIDSSESCLLWGSCKECGENDEVDFDELEESGKH